jgi:hypothetical protein
MVVWTLLLLLTNAGSMSQIFRRINKDHHIRPQIVLAWQISDNEHGICHCSLKQLSQLLKQRFWRR